MSDHLLMPFASFSSFLPLWVRVYHTLSLISISSFCCLFQMLLTIYKKIMNWSYRTLSDHTFCLLFFPSWPFIDCHNTCSQAYDAIVVHDRIFSVE